jgi:hypothetical protein
MTFAGLLDSLCDAPKSKALSSCRLLDGISYFVQREASGSFLKLLFSKNQRVARIDGYYGHIGTTIESFQGGYDVFHTVSLIDTGRNNR